ncbi:hypothetical protein H0H92_008183 [Tricholoma furcatifolium]|nr:hypothetical protein H0H92_008183 [Tricholoma furcatifolium]
MSVGIRQAQPELLVGERKQQAFATATEGEVVVVTAPSDVKESGLKWANPDPYWLGDELPILTDPKKGGKVTQIKRINLTKTKDPKTHRWVCTPANEAGDVIWEAGNPVYVHKQ